MPNVQGQIEKVYHNLIDRQGNNLPPNKVNHKIKMNGELYIIKGVYCPEFVKEGNRVSISYNVWNNPNTKMDNYYVLSEDNKLCINDLSGNNEPAQNDNMDDDLPNSEKEWLNQPATEFDANQLEKQGENRHVLKEQQIFVTALLKSSIEGNCLNPFEADKLNKAILQFKEVYNKNFR